MQQVVWRGVGRPFPAYAVVLHFGHALTARLVSRARAMFLKLLAARIGKFEYLWTLEFVDKVPHLNLTILPQAEATILCYVTHSFRQSPDEQIKQAVKEEAWTEVLTAMNHPKPSKERCYCVQVRSYDKWINYIHKTKQVLTGKFCPPRHKELRWAFSGKSKGYRKYLLPTYRLKSGQPPYPPWLSARKRQQQSVPNWETRAGVETATRARKNRTNSPHKSQATGHSVLPSNPCFATAKSRKQVKPTHCPTPREDYVVTEKNMNCPPATLKGSMSCTPSPLPTTRHPDNPRRSIGTEGDNWSVARRGFCPPALASRWGETTRVTMNTPRKPMGSGRLSCHPPRTD